MPRRCIPKNARRSNLKTDKLEPPRVLLIANYEPDKQQSMLRFSRLLERKLRGNGVNIDLLQPAVLAGRWTFSHHAIDKWIGYIDKFVLFPLMLRRRIAASKKTLIHICDHSNSPYTTFLGDVPIVVTCHDLLAVRGALGEDTDCPASMFGRLLQRWILYGLRRASFVACDSIATRDDLIRLAGLEVQARSNVIHLAQNHPYKRIDAETAWERLRPISALSSKIPFLLHVGSNLKRKNREGVLRVAANSRLRWSGLIVFAGEALEAATWKLADQLTLRDQIVEMVNPTNEVLEALYNVAFAMVYPSRHEGFGWPVIEANACGCPVICSNRTSLPEIAGDGAAIFSPDDWDGMCNALASLRDPQIRQRFIEAGFKNALRFDADRMAEAYKLVYLRVAAAFAGSEKPAKQSDGKTEEAVALR